MITSTLDHILRNLQILTESSQRITAELKTQHPAVDWRGLSGLRNVLVRDYFGINVGRVWSIVERDLPVFKAQVIGIRVRLGEKAATESE